MKALAVFPSKRNLQLVDRPEPIALAEDAASYLAELRTLTVGFDYLSGGNPEVHRTLLGAGVCIIEALNLAQVSPGQDDLLCLPLKIPGSDGAPARALLRSRSTGE